MNILVLTEIKNKKENEKDYLKFVTKQAEDLMVTKPHFKLIVFRDKHIHRI